MSHAEPHGAGGERRHPPQRNPWVRVATREPADRGRSAPRMRFDVLQAVAWVAGLYVVIAGLVVLARAGFDELTLYEPVVHVAGLPGTPLLAFLLVILGVVLLAGATGEVAERELRFGGVMIAIVGTVWLIEPAAFAPYLGVARSNGAAALGVGAAVTLASFVPPLSIRRPGVPEETGAW